MIRRISITGPESTGKSSLAVGLARHYGVPWVPEFARQYLMELNRPYTRDDISHIAREQLKLEDKTSRHGEGMIFCDTDLLVTRIWSEFKYGTCDPWLIRMSESHIYDLYLLCDIDLPWEDDPLREHPASRKELFDLYFQTLDRWKVPFEVISGQGSQRLSNAISAVDRALKITACMDSISSHKIKVLFLPRWYPNRNDPMPGLFIERHARSVARHCQVSVLYVHPDPGMASGFVEEDWQADDELLQLRIYYGPFNRKIPVISTVVNFWRYARMNLSGYRKIKQKAGKPDLVHVNVLTRLGALAMLNKWLTGIPYVVTEHWTRYLPHMDNFRGWFRKAMTRLVVRNASAMLPVTENLRQAMVKHRLKNNRWIVIPNVVDTRMFSPAEKPPAGTMKSILHVSCFEDKQKNISGILRVLKLLSNQRQDWICHMVGDGIHYRRLVDTARDLGLEGERVVFHGLKENEELAKLMKEADFQLMFSRFENLPVVILESFACGVPVLSTDVGGIREHLHPELGKLIPSEDEKELLDQVSYMLDHSREYDRDRIRTYAVDHFSREVIGRQLFEVYKGVVSPDGDMKH